MRINVQVFGKFVVTAGDVPLSGISNRRSKALTALKYMAAHHSRPVTQEELINLLWPGHDCPDPHSSLKYVIHRLRKLLAACDGDAQCIVYSQGAYSWGEHIKLETDAAEFEKTLNEAKSIKTDEATRIELLKKAIGLYRSEFMAGETGELWLTNFRNYYRRLFLGAVSSLVEYYMRQADFEEAGDLLGKAIEVEPYEESLYARQIETLMLTGELASARQQYKNIEKLLRKEFDAGPSSDLQRLWPEIAKEPGNYEDGLHGLKTLLDSNVRRSAMLCGGETFKRLYSYYKYINERIHLPAFLGLVSLVIDEGSEGGVEMRSAMKTLGQIMLRTLRFCDIVCQHTASQFAVMITGAGEKHKMIPFIRVRKLFEKESGISDVSLSVQVVSIRDGDWESIRKSS